jgi:hypothetical protein
MFANDGTNNFEKETNMGESSFFLDLVWKCDGRVGAGELSRLNQTRG